MPINIAHYLECFHITEIFCLDYERVYVWGMEKIKESIIGKKYIAIDNSFSIELSRNMGLNRYTKEMVDSPYLAGTSQLGDYPKICTIVTEPFTINVVDEYKHKDNKEREHLFVIVSDDSNRQHIVLWHESGVEIENRIEGINRHHDLNGWKGEPMMQTF